MEEIGELAPVRVSPTAAARGSPVRIALDSISSGQRRGRGARSSDGHSPSSSSARSTGFPSPCKSEGGFRGKGRKGTASKSSSTPRRPSMRRSASASSTRRGGSEPSTWRVSGTESGTRPGSWRGSLAGSSRRLFRGSGPTAVGNWMSVVSGRAIGGDGTAVTASTHIALKAAGEGDEMAVLSFLDAGGDANAKGKTGSSTSLSRAAAKGHVAIVNLLLERGAAVNAPGRGGLTPLHEAAGCGQLEVCRTLLGAGAAVAARDHSSRCPLHYAGGSVAVTQLLLDFGADPEAQDKNGQRPDAMAMNQEARALIRDARCAVREYGVGDNASRVIASLRRELDNLEREGAGARAKASEESSRRDELQTDLDTLRGRLSELSKEVEDLKREAAASQDGSEDSNSEAPAVIRAELRQARASLKVARAATSEEKRRREDLEQRFDACVAEAVAKAIATAATRLLTCDEASNHSQASRTVDTHGLKGVPLADGDKGGGEGGRAGGGVSNASRDSGGERGGGQEGKGGGMKGKKEKKWKTEEGGSGLEEDEDEEEGGKEEEEEGSRPDTSLKILQKNGERGKGWAHEAGAGLGSMLEMFCIPAGREGQKRFCMP